MKPPELTEKDRAMIQKAKLRALKEEKVFRLIKDFLRELDPVDRNQEVESFLAVALEPTQLWEVQDRIKEVLANNPHLKNDPEERDELTLEVIAEMVYEAASEEQIRRWERHQREKEPLESLVE